MRHHLAQRVLVRIVRGRRHLGRLRPFLRRQLQPRRIRAVLHQPRRHLRHRQNPVDHPGIDRRARHARVLGLLRRLRDRQPAALLDPLDPERPVAIRPAEDDRRRIRPMRIGQRAEEEIDRDAPPAVRFHGRQPQLPVRRREKHARRDHIDRIRLHLLLILRLHHRHRRRARDDLIHDAAVLRREVEHDHERHPGVRAHRREKALQRRDAPRRPAEPDHRQHAIPARRHDVIELIPVILLHHIWRDRGQPGFYSHARGRSGGRGIIHGERLAQRGRSARANANDE